jgi:4-hydroxy-2-oxoheptanedioate aldolase
MIVVLIEDVEAIRNLKEILTVPEIDCFLVGPADLAHSMGAKYAGQSSHPEVQSVVREAIKTIVASGRVAGTPVNDDSVVDFLNMGVQFLSVQTAPYVVNGLKQFTQKVQTTLAAQAG